MDSCGLARSDWDELLLWKDEDLMDMLTSLNEIVPHLLKAIDGFGESACDLCATSLGPRL